MSLVGETLVELLANLGEHLFCLAGSFWIKTRELLLENFEEDVSVRVVNRTRRLFFDLPKVLISEPSQVNKAGHLHTCEFVKLGFRPVFARLSIIARVSKGIVINPAQINHQPFRTSCSHVAYIRISLE